MIKNRLKVEEVPLWTGAASVYPYNIELKDRFSFITNFDEPFDLYRISHDRKFIYLPREFCPLGEDKRSKGFPISMVSKFVPRSEEQIRVVEETEKRLKEGRSLVLSASTGMGKTYMASDIIASIGVSTLIIVHKEDLVLQWIKALREVLKIPTEKIGLLKGNNVSYQAPIVIGMIQTIRKINRYDKWVYNRFGLTVVDESFPEDVELLTPKGWVSVKDITMENEIMQVDTSREMSFVYPDSLVKHKAETLVGFKNTNCDLLATPNHQHLVFQERTGEVKKIFYKNLGSHLHNKHLLTGIVSGNDSLTNWERLLLAYQADGCYLGYRVRLNLHCYRFSFRKKRKIDRLTKLLQGLGLSFNRSINVRGDTSITFWLEEKLDKDLSWISFRNSSSYYKELLSEIVLWDGWITKEGGRYYSTTNEMNSNVVQICGALAGFCSKKWARRRKNKRCKIEYRISWNEHSYRTMKALSEYRKTHNGDVYCVRVPTGNVLIRRNGKICVTGNCHRIAADRFSETMWMFNSKLRLGLSATPYRSDGKDVVFSGHLGKVLVKSSLENLTPKVVLVYTKYIQPSGIYITAARTQKLNVALSQNMSRNKTIGHYVAKTYKAERNILVVSELRGHLELLHSTFLTCDIPSSDMGYYIGGMSEEDRNFSKSKKIVLATYRMISEGTDVPHWDTIVLATPRSDIKQVVGRILRLHPDKKEPLVIDIVDHLIPILNGFSSKRIGLYRSKSAKVVRVNEV